MRRELEPILTSCVYRHNALPQGQTSSQIGKATSALGMLMREIVRGRCTNTARKSTPTLNSGRQVLTAPGSRTLTLSVLRLGFQFDALPAKPHPTRQAATAGLPSFCHCHSCLHHCQALLSFRSVLFRHVHPRFAVTFSSSAGTLTPSAPIKAQLQDSLSLSDSSDFLSD